MKHENIAIVEGLGLPLSWASSYITTELVPQLRGSFTVTTFAWNTVPADLSSFDLAVAHSWGAAKICGYPPGNLPPKVITIDPRWTGFDSFSTTHSKWANYYERNFFFNLPGCPVSGANNVLVTGYSHVMMPSYPLIAQQVNALIAAQ